MKTTNWIAAFPGLQTLSPELLKSLTDTAEVVSLPAGTQIFGAGKVPEAYLLLLDGVVRVQQISDSGREIVLYRVSAGESCALTTACLMGYEEYHAEGIAETNARPSSGPHAQSNSPCKTSTFVRTVFQSATRSIRSSC